MYNRRLIISFGAALAIGAWTLAAAQATNVWTNVTPAGIDLTSSWGTETVGADPVHPSNLYANFNNYGIYRSTDYGVTWTGPINTGTNGGNITGDGNFTIASGGMGNPPILYGGFEHNSPGFWRSTNGGVDWQNFNIAPAGGRQDIMTADVNPYNANHLIVPGHEHTGTYESTDGGETWTTVNMDAGMNTTTAFVCFVNTGDAATTAQTFLWIGLGGAGTWRTANSGAAWTKVDNNNSTWQVFQPGNGVVFAAGMGSAHGNGVLRSTDYGQTWTHVGAAVNEVAVFGTPTHVYAMFGEACEPCSISPTFEVAPLPGTTGWTSPATPSGMTGAGISQAAVTYDGANYVIVASCWNKGLWRYVESSTTGAMTNEHIASKLDMVRTRCIKLTRTGIVVRASQSQSFDITGRIVNTW